MKRNVVPDEQKAEGENSREETRSRGVKSADERSVCDDQISLTTSDVAQEQQGKQRREASFGNRGQATWCHLLTHRAWTWP